MAQNVRREVWTATSAVRQAMYGQHAATERWLWTIGAPQKRRVPNALERRVGLTSYQLVAGDAVIC